jgi:hypothetical protein
MFNINFLYNNEIFLKQSVGLTADVQAMIRQLASFVFKCLAFNLINMNSLYLLICVFLTKATRLPGHDMLSRKA